MMIAIVADKNDGRITRSRNATLTDRTAMSRTDSEAAPAGIVLRGKQGRYGGPRPRTIENARTRGKDTRAEQRGSDFANVARKKKGGPNKKK